MSAAEQSIIELSTGAGAAPLRTRWLRFGDTPASDAGEAVLGLHMLGLDADSFAGVGKLLADRGYPAYSYDQRGHHTAADQPPADFAQWIDDAKAALTRVPAERVHLVGSSMGGSVAARLAAATPTGRIATLSLIATLVRGEPVFAERGSAEAAGSLDAILPTTIARWFGDADKPSPEAQHARDAIRRMTPASHDAAWRALAQFRGYDDIASQLPPTLCLAFTDDLSTPPSALDTIANTLKLAGTPVRRADVPGTGHAGLLCKPHDIAHELLAHFKQHTSTP